jgi:hypothetical protein
MQHATQNTNKELIVQVGDLLHRPGKKDVMSISDFSLDSSRVAISWNIILTAISETEVIVQLRDIARTHHTLCDYCATEIALQQKAHDQLYTYIVASALDPEVDDSVFLIESNMTIDLSLAIRDMILLCDEVQHICDACVERLDKENSSQWPMEPKIWSNIVFN